MYRDWLAAFIQPFTMPSSVASIDSFSSASSFDSDAEFRLAQEEWEESIQQLEQLASVVLLPFLGKWMGRRWSHWGASFHTSIRSSDLSCSICSLPSSRPRKGFLSWLNTMFVRTAT
jgi:hypothetical protein